MSDGLPALTWFGVAHPWECDAMGHFNAGFYGRIFDDAGAGAMHHLGYSVNAGVAAGQGWAEVRVDIDYRHEIRANCILSVTSRVTGVGRTSLRIEHVLRDETEGRVAATARSTTVCFDLAARKAIPLPGSIRARAQVAMGPPAAPAGTRPFGQLAPDSPGT